MAAENQQKHLEFTFSIKALPFHSRASIRGMLLKRGTGSGERGAGNRERGTEVWERVVSGNLHKIQYGR